MTGNAVYANFSAMPLVRRARDYHLYDHKGNRFLDLYRGDGSALLGYSIPGLKQAQKNAISDNPIFGFDTAVHRQFLSKLERIFPEHLTFAGLDRFDPEVLNSMYNGVSEGHDMHMFDRDLPGFSDFDSGNPFSFYAPFSDISPARSFAFVLPVYSPGRIIVYGVAKNIVGEGFLSQIEAVQAFRRNRCAGLSPALCRAGLIALEALCVLQGLRPSSDNTNTNAGLNQVRDLSQTFGGWDELYWSSFSIGSWQRKGPYLLHSFEIQEYERIFRFALENGVILNPRHGGFSILPGLVSNGERESLRKVLAATGRY